MSARTRAQGGLTLSSLLRHFRLLWLRVTRSLSLSQRFLVAAVLVVAVASLGLGIWAAYYVQRGITDGVASTAAASIDSLVAHQIGEVATGEDLSAGEKATLDAVFAIGNDADTTRLLQIRIRGLDGRVIYESAGSLNDPEGGETEHLRDAASGVVSSRLVQIDVPPIGTLEGLPIEVLEIFTPLHRGGTGEIFAVADLYYSARSVLDQRDRAQVDVWILVGLSGLVVIGALYLLVDRASATIARQRMQLAGNLAASRRLAEENRALHDASEELRQNANFANEALLAQVGSDIHDGPIQLLTLIILRLSTPAARAQPELLATGKIATEAMEELRNISNGLVLPELTPLSLTDALQLAVSRHEHLTGVNVRSTFADLPETVQLVVKICAYRVIQEALTNAFRHGAASGQTVAAEIVGERLVIRVTNRARKGRGGAGKPGLGLRGMRFRVESLGGTLRTDIGTAASNVVEAQIPLGPPA